MVKAELEVETGYIVLECSFEEKNIPKSLGASWDRLGKRWYFNTYNFPILDDIYKSDEVELSKELNSIYRDFKYREEYSEKIKRANINDIPDDEMYEGLYNHQKKSLAFGFVRQHYADLSDCGTGKTIASLAVVNKINKDFECSRGLRKEIRALVVAPKSIIMSGWVADCEKAFPDLTAIPVIGTREQKIEAFNSDANIYVTNYETMNQGFNIPEGFFDMLICDEAVKLKNPNAQWTKNITKLSKDIEYKIIISGLITPNNLMEIYAPFNILEYGILGKSFYQFRTKYFTPNPFSYMNSEWVPKKNSESKIMKKVERLVIRHKKSECLDLPDKSHVLREVSMAAKQKRDYKKMAKEFILQLADGDITAVNAGAKIQKLQQIASGFIYTEEDGKRVTKRLHNQKFKELKDILEGELIDEQVIIFCSYQAEIDIFRDTYPDESYIVGNQKTSDQEDNIKRFLDGDSRILFANVQASKYGLTFTNCSNVIYYSLTYSLDDLYQSQERIHRIGQTKKCNYIYLIAKDTIDKKIYNAVTKKQSLNDMLYEMIEEIQKKKEKK